MCARTILAHVCLGASLTCIVSAQQPASPHHSVPTFGTTVRSSGLRGDIYFLPADTRWLPNFKHLKPIGTLYTNILDIPPTYFDQGFPGITNRTEWFAIDYTGRFWIENPGRYRFGITSDDGAKLYIDGHLIVNNDGTHPPSSCLGALDLDLGIHDIRISYFQGPRYDIALSLGIAAPGNEFQVFDTRRLAPPADSPLWTNSGAPQPNAHSGKIQRGNCSTR